MEINVRNGIKKFIKLLFGIFSLPIRITELIAAIEFIPLKIEIDKLNFIENPGTKDRKR